jgi:hypothetical protein
MYLIILPLITIDTTYCLLMGKDQDKISILESTKKTFKKIEDHLIVNNDTKKIFMLFDDDSIEKLKQEIVSPNNKMIKIYSNGGYHSTASQIDSIVILMKKHNKKIIASPFCYSMCANFMALIPSDMLIQNSSSSLNFHYGSNVNKRTTFLSDSISFIENFIFYSFIYHEYINNNSSMEYIEFMSALNETSDEKWVNCSNNKCELITI